MKMLSVEELKIKTWNRVDDCTFGAMDCENEIYSMTGFHIPTAIKCENGELIKYNLLYQKKENEISLSVHVYFEHGNGSPIFTDSIVCDGDILGLFPEEEPKGELESFFEGDDMRDVINRFKEKFPNVYEAITDNHTEYVLDNLNEYDIPSHVERDIAESWIENNPSEAFDMAKDQACDSDIRDFVRDYICDNL